METIENIKIIKCDIEKLTHVIIENAETAQGAFNAYKSIAEVNDNLKNRLTIVNYLDDNKAEKYAIGII